MFQVRKDISILEQSTLKNKIKISRTDEKLILCSKSMRTIQKFENAFKFLL